MTISSENAGLKVNASRPYPLDEEGLPPRAWHRHEAPPLIPPGVTAFFRRNAGALLYSLSALSILAGLSLLIGPLLRNSARLRDILPCIGTLQVYELGLLAVALLLVLWRTELEDSATLVVLIALFLAGSGLLLDLVVTDSRAWSWGVGIGALALAGTKLALVRRYVLRQPWGLLMATAGATVLWTFAMPLILSELWRASMGAEVLRLAWDGGWWLCGAGALALLLQGWQTRSAVLDEDADDLRDARPEVPLLRRPQMVWAFALIPLVVSGLQQRALAYVFDLPDGLANYLPLIALAAFGILELRRIAGWRLLPWDYVVAAVPALVAFVVAQAHLAPAAPAWSGPALLGLPLMFSVGVGGILAALAIHHERRGLLYLVPLYAIVALLTFNPTQLALPATLNWQTTGALLFVVAFLVLCHLRLIPGVYLLQVIVGLLCLAPPVAVRMQAEALGISLPVLALLVVGVSALAAYILARPAYPRHVAIAGALFVAAACFGIADPAWPWILAGTVAVGVLLWCWRGEMLLALPLFLPVLRLVQARLCPGWILVTLSFVLLGAGFLLSVRKSRQAETALRAQDQSS